MVKFDYFPASFDMPLLSFALDDLLKIPGSNAGADLAGNLANDKVMTPPESESKDQLRAL